MPKRWYVVQSKPYQEQFAVDNLKKQKFKIFYPVYMASTKRRGKVIEEARPLFPQYLFVKFNVEKDHWQPVNSTRGVIGLLGVIEGEFSEGDYVVPLPKGFIEAMIKSADRKGFLKLEKSIEKLIQYQPGNLLKVNEGCFKDLIGECVKSAENRVVILLSLLNKKIAVSLNIDAVSPAVLPGQGGSVQES